MNSRNFKSCLAIAVLVLLQVMAISSCKGPKSSQGENSISALVQQLQSQCPKDMGNGTTLDSVYFVDKTITYRMKMSDEAIATVNPTTARDSIIGQMNEKLKRVLLKDGCNVKYKYISDNDSIIITILPSELGTAPSEEKKDDNKDETKQDEKK